MKEMILSSSVLITVILAIRALAKGKISAKLQYALWLLVMVRLIVPGTVGNSPISILRILRLPAESVNELNGSSVDSADTVTHDLGTVLSNTDTGVSIYLGGSTAKNISDNENEKANTNTDVNSDIYTNVNASENTGVNVEGNRVGAAAPDGGMKDAADSSPIPILKIVICAVWLLGIAATGGYMLLHQIRFAGYLAVRRKPLQGVEGKYRGLKVYTVEGLPSPCLCGRRIYLDSAAAEDARTLNHILAHEYCHYRQLDPLWAFVRCMLVSIYWFHPLVWAAAYVSKHDSEFACDEAAIRLLGEEERYEYGRTLLGLVRPGMSKMQDIGPVLTMGSDDRRMRERIGRIAGKQKPFILAGGLVLVLAAAVVVITFTGVRAETGEVSQSETASGDSGMQSDAAEDVTEHAKDTEEKVLKLAEQAKQMEQEQMDAAETERMQAEEKARREAEAMAEQARAMQESESVIGLLSSYDEMLLPVQGEGREGEIRELPAAIIRRPSDLWEEYLSQGEDAIIEGLYRLAGWNGTEWQSKMQRDRYADDDTISVYGLYTKEYGLRGVKMIVGEGSDKDVNNFDIPWSFVGNSRVHVFENGPGDETLNGLPRTFAFIQLMPGSEEAYMDYGPEAYELYLCDRYDTGHIELSKVSEGDFILQIQDRISCKINYEEKRIYVYDKDTLVGVTDISEFSITDSDSAKAVINTDFIDFGLGSNAGKIILNVPVSLLIQSEGKEITTLFPSLPFITFTVDCGYFGPDREFTLGKATVDITHVAGTRYIEQPNTQEPRLQVAE